MHRLITVISVNWRKQNKQCIKYLGFIRQYLRL